MQLPRPRTALRAVLPGLVSAVALGMLPAPSYAAPATPTAAARTTQATPALAATGLPKLEDDAVEALRRVTTARTHFDQAVAVRLQRVDRVNLLGDQAAEASERARRLHAQVDDSRTGLLFDAVTSFVTGDDTKLDRAVAAIEDEKFALGLLTTAEDALLQANLDVQSAEKELAAARDEAAEIESRTAAMRAARTTIRLSQPTRDYRPASRHQRRTDRKALAAWEDYLVDVARAGLVPPDAEALADPENLVEPFEPVHDRHGRAVPGVAETDTEDGTLTVLSAESVRAVAATFRGLGTRDAVDAVGERAYTCGGLAGTAWEPTELGVPATADTQWDTLAAVPTGAVDRGDLVFTAARGDEPSSVGVVVGDGLVVAADPGTGTAAVREIGPRAEQNLIGARRPSLAAGNGLRVTQTATPQCAEAAPVTAPVPPSTTTGGWRAPVPTGYAPTTEFGVAGPLWSSGQHTGLDFAAPAGTPVFAARAGVVSVERPEWAGRLVRVDHGDGVESWYAHLSAVDVVPGQLVAGGERIGAVGSAGNSTGPHLHFEVRLDGTPVDPAAVLGLTAATATGATSASGWGGHTNGEIDPAALCDATGTGHLLRCDAAVGFRLLRTAYRQHFGTELCITDSYRDRATQDQLFRTKRNLAATPGTSNHGWGLAVDLCGGVDTFGTPQHEWVATVGATYGWVHPDWAKAAGGRPEPWHFEYGALT